MNALVKRNLLIFFRDKGSVFFSLLGVLIIFALYVLFLGDLAAQGIQGISGARLLMDRWIMSGLLAVTPITTALGAMGVLLDDKNRGMFKDFSVAPLKRSIVTASYLTSGFLISLILTLVTWLLSELYVVACGGTWLSIQEAVTVLALVLFMTASSSLVMFYLISWFKSSNAYAAASMVLGTLIGFLTGIYIPIGSLPKPVQVAIKLFPPSHAAVAFRQVTMNRPLTLSFQSLPAQALTSFRLALGIDFEVGDRLLPALLGLAYLLLLVLIVLGLTLHRMRKKEK